MKERRKRGRREGRQDEEREKRGGRKGKGRKKDFRTKRIRKEKRKEKRVSLELSSFQRICHQTRFAVNAHIGMYQPIDTILPCLRWFRIQLTIQFHFINKGSDMILERTMNLLQFGNHTNYIPDLKSSNCDVLTIHFESERQEAGSVKTRVKTRVKTHVKTQVKQK